MNTFKYKNININYIIEGSENKDVILFLHGWGGNTDSFKCFSNTFKNSFKCISIDFPPHGKSEEPKEPWRIEDYGEMIYAFLQELFIKKTNIISHSFGGRVAIYLAGKYNHIVDKLVLISSAGIKPKRGIIYRTKILKYKLYKKLNSEKAKSMGSKDYRELSTVMKQTFSNVVNEDLSKLCKLITNETLILFGKKDKDTPIYMAKRLRKLITNSELILFEKCGHFVYIENLHQITHILVTFLNT